MSSPEESGGGTAAGGRPLVVDVDGTLASTDLLWEGLLRVVCERPRLLPHVLAGLAEGRAEFKARVAETADLDLDLIPLNPAVEDLIAAAREDGRPVVLASAAHRSQVEELARRIGADGTVASDGRENLKGERKLRAVRRATDEFDYVGDANDDLPLLEAARRGYLVDPGPWTRRRASGTGDTQNILTQRSWEKARSWLRALRPHQWSKNGLLLLPILAAHLPWSWELAADVATGLAAFSLLASAVYLANDLADLPADRRHPVKRDRPLAAGELSIPAGIASVLVLVVVSSVLALRLPTAFLGTLGAYLALNLAYSLDFKQRLVVDVVVLAALYTVRVVAGAALASIELTGWFLAFSIFIFLSLAVLKRVIELQGAEDRGAVNTLPGRAYRAADLPVLRAVGPAAGVMSALVYCLYITGPVRELYDRPDVLWLGLPLFLYWIVRVWILALRGAVEEDPVVFVLRDPPSYAVLAAFLAVVFLAG